MKRIITFDSGIIYGADMLVVIDILPQLKDCFTQRKTYFEYYFKPIEVDLTLDNINELSDKFYIVLNYYELMIKVD